jgi:hypothetical protein
MLERPPFHLGLLFSPGIGDPPPGLANRVDQVLVRVRRTHVVSLYALIGQQTGAWIRAYAEERKIPISWLGSGQTHAIERAWLGMVTWSDALVLVGNPPTSLERILEVAGWLQIPVRRM